MTANTAQTCLDPQRRADVRRHGSNGIDYVDVSENQSTLTVYFLREAPQNLERANVVIDAGANGKKLKVLEVRLCSVDDPEQDDCMFVSLDKRGDPGKYTIRVVELDAEGNPTDTPMKGFDPRYAQLEFRFDTSVTSDVDCKQRQVCVAPQLSSPDINYLAKDYGSFLQLIYDRLALIMPEWQERHVPDEEVALVEILAYVADYLSYYQDAVATEAYLGTARQRISVRRHVRLLDYAMHEGCNARAWVVLNTSEKVTGLDPSEIYFVAGYQGVARGPLLSQSDIAALPGESYLVFEPTAPDLINLYPGHNQITFYTWGNRQCCLAAGATSATLLDRWEQAMPEAQIAPQRQDQLTGHRKKAAPPAPPEPVDPGKTTPQTRKLNLKAGDLLLLKEVIGPGTGSPDDADPNHRQVVRLTRVKPGFDSLYDPPVPVAEVDWAVEDALTFALCLSTIGPAEQGCQYLSGVGVACGNVMMADCGSWIPTSESLGSVPQALVQHSCARAHHPADVQISAGPFRPKLKRSPLTFRQSPRLSQGAASALTRDPRLALPQIKLRSILPLPDGSGPLFSPEEFEHPERLAARVANPMDEASLWLEERLSKQTISLLQAFDPNKPMEPALEQALSQYLRIWTPKPDLLASRADDCDYVVEIDDSGVAHLRFGDGELGRAVEAGETFFADYRVGNGPDGNVGAGAIQYLVLASDNARKQVAGAMLTPSNPLPAQGGTAPESIDEVKLFAPGTFLTTLERAITADDYAALAQRNPKLQRAAATLLWTGTHYEAHVAIDPLGTDAVDAGLIEEIQDYLYRFRRIGHDLVVVPAQYVPLDVAMIVNVLPDYISGHVRAALLDAFSDHVLVGGRRGFFHPDNLSFGDNIYLSQLVAAAHSIAGVASVTVTRLERLYAGSNHELANGFLPIGPLEVAQLDNDPAAPEHGRLTLTLRGGL